MTADPAPPGLGAGGVWVISEDQVLSSALTAALRSLGWHAQSLPEAPKRSASLRRGDHGPSAVVLVADEGGQLPDPHTLPAWCAGSAVVAVGTRAAAASLAIAAARGAAAIDADQPFRELIAAIHRTLSHPCSGPPPVARAAALRQRAQEARQFTHLTGREQDVLGAMILGQSAAQVAAGAHVSVTTVRSHIHAVLTKLGVSSQLAAVALAHRSCHEPRVVDYLRRFHQF